MLDTDLKEKQERRGCGGGWGGRGRGELLNIFEYVFFDFINLVYFCKNVFSNFNL